MANELGNPKQFDKAEIIVDQFENAKDMISYLGVRNRDGFTVLSFGKVDDLVRVNSVGRTDGVLGDAIAYTNLGKSHIIVSVVS